MKKKKNQPQVSLLIPNSKPAQIRPRPSNGCRSSRRDLVKHQRQVSPQTQHHHEVSYNVLVAKKFEFSNSHTISLSRERLPIAAHSVNTMVMTIINDFKSNLSTVHDA